MRRSSRRRQRQITLRPERETSRTTNEKDEINWITIKWRITWLINKSLFCFNRSSRRAKKEKLLLFHPQRMDRACHLPDFSQISSHLLLLLPLSQGVHNLSCELHVRRVKKLRHYDQRRHTTETLLGTPRGTDRSNLCPVRCSAPAA